MITFPHQVFHSVLLFLLQVNLVFADEWVIRDASIMGTTVHAEVWHEDNAIAEKVADDVIRIMEQVNATMSPYLEDSELSRINREAASHAVPISAELYGVIADALRYSELTSGAFDITFASVGYLYDYRDSRRPQQEAIQAALPRIDFRHIQLDSENRSIAFLRSGVRIDLGGIAKGYAVDLAIEHARTLGVEHILVSAGGDSRILGDRKGRPWVIGVRHPVEKGKIIAKIPLANEALSTSGDYERYFDEDGVRYHHIIDPKTGDSARLVRSVTVLGPRATDTDALSTSVFVLGPDKGLALLDELEGIEGIIVDARGKLLYSSGLQSIQ